MNFGLLLPIGLLALASVIVPLLIHLIRRPEQQILDFPALRWLRESVRPRRRVRFEDLRLLMARLLLLTMLAFLLAMPVIVGDWHATRHWIVLSAQSDAQAAKREFGGTDADWRWLAPGFPAVDDSPSPDSVQPFASLLREFDASLAPEDSLTVLVPAEVQGLDAERLTLTRKVDWRIVAARPQPPATPAESTPRIVALRHAGVDSEGLLYMRAALAAWRESAPSQWTIDDQAATAPLTDKTDWLIWLEGPLPESMTPWILRGGRVVLLSTKSDGGEIVWRDDDGAAIASDRRVGAGHVINVLRPLTPTSLPALLDAAFPARLQDLFEDKPAAPSSAVANDARPERVERPHQPTPTSLVPLLSLLIAAVFLVERFLATRRRVQP